LHFLLPVGVLIWCLMIEEMSPSLSAFWSIVMLVALMLTQRSLLDFFRGTRRPDAWREGWRDVVEGLNDGARNMIGIGVATATAGVIVGAITLTGLALRMTEFVEFVSHGNVIAMLLFIMFACLVLGLGVPTTANYVLVATLMAPVVVELGAQAGLVIPLIAVHLFVFYYGIMGDITPPVGLATFAAVAISGEDMIETGIQGSLYALRTVILPFIWIFNPQLLLIDVWGTGELVRVVVASTIAMLVFAAVTMNWFRVKSRLWENAVLLVAVALLFRPDFFMDLLTDEYVHAPPSRIYDVARELPEKDRLVMVIRGSTIEGDEVTKTAAIELGEPNADGRKRLADAGITLTALGDTVKIAGVKFGSRARKSGVEQGWDIVRLELPSGRPTAHWFYVPAFALIALVWWVQGRRMSAVRAAVAA
jgi:TRAP transporter 4TM/12TM fusion protein